MEFQIKPYKPFPGIYHHCHNWKSINSKHIIELLNTYNQIVFELNSQIPVHVPRGHDS